MSEACICGAPARALHHVVYQQHVRRYGGDLGSRANFLPLCTRCHERHHNRTAPIPFDSLPESSVEFAHELMGDKAIDYLRRHYPTKEDTRA